ncbi:hypothetical protein LLH03_19870 [bacterium]|nr:hypothetical protein [bacterium]
MSPEPPDVTAWPLEAARQVLTEAGWQVQVTVAGHPRGKTGLGTQRVVRQGLLREKLVELVVVFARYEQPA